MSNALVDLMGAAGNLLDGKRTKAVHRTVRRIARSGMSGGNKWVRGAITALRHIDLEDVLVWMRISRRRGPLGAIALLGAGAAVGAGLVVLLSPASGPEVRRSLRRRTSDLGNKARHTFEGARTGALHLEEKAEEAVKDVERRVEEKVTEALRAAREAVKKPD